MRSALRLALLALATAGLTAPGLGAQVPKLRDRYVEAGELFEQGRHDEARALLEGLIASGRSHASIHYLLGLVLTAQGDHQEAIAQLRRSIELAPEEPRYRLASARAHHRTKAFAAAHADLDAAEKLGGRTFELFFLRGCLYVDQQRPDEAEKAYRLAIELDRDNSGGWAGLAMLNRMRGHFDGALRPAETAVMLAPENMEWIEQLAWLEIQRGHPDRALRVAHGLLSADDSGAGAYRRGKLAWYLDDLDTAVADLTDARDSEVEKTACQAALSLGYIRLATADTEAAHQNFEQAWERRVPEFAYWVLAMRWCEESLRLGVEPADQRLRDDLAAAGREPTAQERRVVDLCLNGTGEAEVVSTWRGEPLEACPLLFFAAWRARLRGDEDRYLALLESCVNTGMVDWNQWNTARTILRGLDDAAPEPVLDFGMTSRFEPDPAADDEQVVVVIEDVRAGGAADLHGFARGDVLTRIYLEPITRGRWERLMNVQRIGQPVWLHVQTDSGDEPRQLSAGMAPRR